MKVLVRIIEAGISLTVVIMCVDAFLPMLGQDILNFISVGWGYMVYFFGTTATNSIIAVFCAVFVVYFGRWFISWSSNNGGQTPNNRGN